MASCGCLLLEALIKPFFQPLVTQGKHMRRSKDVLPSPSDVLQHGELDALSSVSWKEKSYFGWCQPAVSVEKSLWEISNGWQGENWGWSYSFAADVEVMKKKKKKWVLVSGCPLGIEQSVYPAEVNCCSSADLSKINGDVTICLSWWNGLGHCFQWRAGTLSADKAVSVL